jgi:hypothetical protein
MKSDLEWRGEFDELACAFHVHRTVGSQDPKDKAAGSKAVRVKEILPHQGELIVRVVEVTTSRSQQDVNGEAATKNCSTRQSMTRRKPPFAEGGAKLNAIGATFARGEAGLKTLCTEFEDDFAHPNYTNPKSFPILGNSRRDDPKGSTG